MTIKLTLLSLICAVAARTYAFDVLDSISFEEKFAAIRNSSDSEQSKHELYRLTNFFKEKESGFFLAKAYHEMGLIHLRQVEYDSCVYYFNNALTLHEENGYRAHAGTIHESFANLYFAFEEYELAVDHLRKSQTIKEEIGNPSYLMHLYANMGTAFFHLDYYDSSYKYLNLTYDLSIALEDTAMTANCFAGIGDLFYMQDEELTAIEYYKKSIALYHQIGDQHAAAVPLFNMGNSFGYLGYPDSSLFYYKKAFADAKAGGNSEYFDVIYLNFAETYIELNNPDSAVQMFQNYIAYRDSVFEDYKSGALLEFEAKYETKEAKQEAALAEKETERVKAQDASKRKTIYVLIITLVAIVIIVFFLVKSAREKAKVKALEVDVKNKEIDSLIKEQEARSYAALLEGQNVERERIAQDLHDRLGGTLAAVKVHFGVMNDKIEALKEENLELFNKVNDLLTDAVQDVRRISHDLASNRLNDLGLRGVVEDLVTVLKTAKKLEVDFYMDDNLNSLGDKKDQEVYAILQEIISNTLKHAGATSIELQLNKQKDVLNILFEDNGTGFDYSSVQGKGLGLKSLKNRVEKLNGTIKFDAMIGRGTIIIINIPL